jgi:hypothetical protein
MKVGEVGYVPKGQLMLNPDYAHLPTSFKRFRCEPNRKRSKFERKGLLSSIESQVGITRRLLCDGQSLASL